jgi:hypothetical protein
MQEPLNERAVAEDTLAIGKAGWVSKPDPNVSLTLPALDVAESSYLKTLYYNRGATPHLLAIVARVTFLLLCAGWFDRPTPGRRASESEYFDRVDRA